METYSQKNNQDSRLADKKVIAEKTHQVDKDSGVYDRLTFSVCQSSHCPSEFSRLQSNASPNTTSSSAYSSVTSSYSGGVRRKSEAAARLFTDAIHPSRVPPHPLVTGTRFSSPDQRHSIDGAKTVATLAVPSMLSNRSRGDSAPCKAEQSYSDDSRLLYNSNSDTTYEKKRLLGKGGFARVYEVREISREGYSSEGPALAAKVISKSRISRPHQREKVDLEVQLMEEARGHPNVVELLESFEDENSICILLELCRKKSLAQYLRRKQYLSESEVCHIVKQIVSGLSHLHAKGIIHRDLKLGNILLTDNMKVKIGDFGLATRAEWDKKKTICGTPNFIAPEVLQRLGHGPESDVWALGCLLYTLLVGKPPFETSSLKETYRCIMKNIYRLPSTLSAEAADLIRSMLRHKPNSRPSIEEILSHPFFFKHSNTKLSLPKTSICSVKETSRKQNNVDVTAIKSSEQPDWSASNVKISNSYLSEPGKEPTSRSFRHVAKSIRRKLSKMSLPMKAVTAALKDNKKHSRTPDVEQVADKENDDVKTNQSSNNNSTTWVKKWVDYSNRYGFGYQLTSGKTCVLFNDGKHLSLLPDQKTMEYASSKSAKVIRFAIDAAPQSVVKYAGILKNFTVYMDKIEPSVEPEELNDNRLLTWNRTKDYVAMFFNDNTMQVNFTKDHVKVNISSFRNDMRVTVVDSDGQFRVFPTNQIASLESSSLKEKLQTALSLLRTLDDSHLSSTSA